MLLNISTTIRLKRLGEVITTHNLQPQHLTFPAPEDTTESINNRYIFNLLKVCVTKVFLEVQQELADVVTVSQSENMLYAAYLHELPPVRTFLSKRPENEKQETKKPETKSQPGKNKLVAEPATPEAKIPLTEYMLVSEAAQILNKDEKTIRRRLISGEIKGIKDKGNWLVDKSAFKSYLNSMKTK